MQFIVQLENREPGHADMKIVFILKIFNFVIREPVKTARQPMLNT